MKINNNIIVSRTDTTIHIKRISIQIYYPYLILKRTDVSLHMPSCIVFRLQKNWEWLFAVGFQVLGFGLGFAVDMSGSPYMKNKLKKKEVI